MFGAHPKTHIANASSYPIMAKVDTNCNPEIKISIPKVGTYSDNVNKGIKAGFNLIPPGEYCVFEPSVGLFDGSWLKRATVYISICSMQGGEVVPIRDNWNLKDNSSAIVTPRNSAVRTKMGTIWTDEEGNNYK